MAEPATQKWMIAAWPGMGNVAVIAAGYLIEKLKLKPVDELAPRTHFDIEAVDVKAGIVASPRVPRGIFFRAAAPVGKADLTVFVGEAQPTSGVYAYAHELLDRAKAFGIERVVTFASLASQLHPSKEPTVYGAVTSKDLLEDLQKLEVKLLAEGQIGGLNGVLLGACAERALAGLCLLAEIPYFAAGVPNPKAAKAVLDAFALMSRAEIDFEELLRHAAVVDKALLELLRRIQQESGQTLEGEEPLGIDAGEEPNESAPEPEGAPPPSQPAKPQPPAEKPLDLQTRQRIEDLFERARRDRSKAVDLKRELDRHGVFNQYENRFLDLFRRAE